MVISEKERRKKFNEWKRSSFTWLIFDRMFIMTKKSNYIIMSSMLFVQGKDFKEFVLITDW